MNIISKVTLRNMKENKKRTIVTIIGVILSVALITATTTLAATFIDFFQRNTMQQTGEWHSKFLSVPIDKVEKIKSNKHVKEICFSKKIGDSFINSSFISLKDCDQAYIDKMHLKIQEGKLPSNSNEIVVSENVMKYVLSDYKIGDEITIDVGELEENENYFNRKILNGKSMTLKIVGVLDGDSYHYNYDYYSTMLSKVDINKIDSNVDVSVIYNEIDQSIYNVQDEIAKNLDVKVESNNELIRSYGVDKADNTFEEIYGAVLIVIIIVMVSSIFVIRNGFYISIRDRQRYFGIVSSVGATAKQKRLGVYVEAVFIGLVGIPLGLLLGVGGMAVTFAIINPLITKIISTGLGLITTVSYLSIGVAILFSILTIFFSALIPAIKSSKIPAIHAIRETNNIKIKKKKIKTSKLVRKIFGFSGDLSMKNIKRNPKAYRTTIFSLTTSVVLFLCVTFALSHMKNYVNVMYNDNENTHDLYFECYSDHNDKDEQIIRSLVNLENIKRGEIMKMSSNSQSQANIPLSFYDDSYKKFYEEAKKNHLSDDYINIKLISLDDKSLEGFAEDAGTTLQKMKNENSCIIQNDQSSYLKDGNKRKFINYKYFNNDIVGKKLNFLSQQYYYETEGSKPTIETSEYSLNVAGLTNQHTLYNEWSNDGFKDIVFIVSEDTLNKLVSTSKIREPSIRAELKLKDTSQFQETVNEIRKITKNIKNSFVMDYEFVNKQKANNSILIISIFGFGFIALITLISLTNIINTASTSIDIRTKEFAMLRSCGMGPKVFKRMILFESLFYGMKALLFGLPISLMCMYGIHKVLNKLFAFEFYVHWEYVAAGCIGVFVITAITMLYASNKIKKQNIIDGLRDENI